MKLSADALDALGRNARVIVLADCEVLANEGDEASEVFIVRAGRIVVTTQAGAAGADASPDGAVVLGYVGAGELIGEIAVVTGRRRMASLHASEPSVVWGVERGVFEEWMRREPALADVVAAASRERIDRAQVATMIASVVGNSDSSCVQDMLDAVEWRRVAAGTVLFREGDGSDAAYFVVSGRLAVTQRRPDGSERSLREMGNGEVVGELGLLDAAPRSATVRAVRDTTLARFSGDQFEALVARHAGLALHVARGVLRKLGRPERAPRAASVALVVTAPIEPVRFAAAMLAEISRFGRSIVLSSVRVDALLDQPRVAQLDVENVGVPRLSEFLHQADVENEHVVYQADVPGPAGAAVSAWSKRCLGHADRVIVVLSAAPDDAEERSLRAFLEELRRTEGARWWLAVVHPADTTRPTGSADLLQRYGGEDIVHLRRGSDADEARLARLAIGRGYGLVLSGGGARGFAHIGVYRALCELGVPVDRVGGASIGAPIGAAIGLALNPQELLEMVSRQFRKLLDYTFPVVSVLKGARIARSIDETLGGWDIEDLWLGYYCVSTNLTASRIEVHRRGDLARAVRASVAIPGVLPPVPYRGDLLVDGGVLANLPVDQMREHPGIGTIIAVNVAPEAGPHARLDFGTSVSGWRALRSSLGRRRSPYPSLTGVLLRTMIVGSVRDRPQLDDERGNDLRIDIDLKGVNLLAFDRVRPVAEAGYAAARPVLEAWLDAHRKQI